jgi:hypothetical protein
VRERVARGGTLWLKSVGLGSLRLESGRLWLTREGDAEDYFLEGGEALLLPAGTWLAQALEPSLLEWSPGPLAIKVPSPLGDFASPCLRRPRFAAIGGRA